MLRHSSTENKKVMQLSAHLAGWIVFFGLMFSGNGLMRNNPLPFACNFLLLAGYFYLNAGILVPRLLSKKKVAAYIGVTLLCFILISFVFPSITMHYIGFTQPPDMPFPRRPFGGSPPPDVSTLQGVVDRWRLYSMRLHNPTTQFLLVFIISTGLTALTQWYRQQQQLLELEKSRIQAELSLLRSQIHPHFMFNCLNSIYYMTLSKDDKAPKTILSLADLLRFVITESDADYIPIEKEIGMLEEYLNLQSLRASEKFELQFVKEGSLTGYSITPLTFIPFVENAFKYGISAHINCFIHIRIKMENDTLYFDCDNSVVSTMKTHTHSSGVGLENSKKRLELAYPDRHALTISRDSSAYRVRLQIQIV